MIEFKEPVLVRDLGMLLPLENSKTKRRFGIYRCFCGKEFKTRTHYIKSKHTKSCGCIKDIVKSGYKHGQYRHELYGHYRAMIERCYNPKQTCYDRYGGRGIRVCGRWLEDINNYIEDMYPTFKKGLTIERIDVNGNYEKSNCKWVDMVTQAHNKDYDNIMKYNTTGYIGVWKAKENIYVAELKYENKKHRIGRFKTALEGAIAREKYIIKHNLPNLRNNLLVEDYDKLDKELLK